MTGCSARRLLASWFLLAATLLSRPFTTAGAGAPRGEFPTASTLHGTDALAIPAARPATLLGIFESARVPGPFYRHHTGSAGAALPAAAAFELPPTPRVERIRLPGSDTAGAWPHGFPYYPTGPPLA